MTPKTLLTIDDFERLPQEMVKNKELVDRELVDVSGNTPVHLLLQGLLLEVLRPLVRTNKLGRVFSELEYDFDGDTHGPDISFFGPAKVTQLDMKKRVQRFVPDFAIEIVSQSDTFIALFNKEGRYRRCGTAEVWIVSIETREVFVYSDARTAILGQDDELSTPLIPGFSERFGDLPERL